MTQDFSLMSTADLMTALATDATMTPQELVLLDRLRQTLDAVDELTTQLCRLEVIDDDA